MLCFTQKVDDFSCTNYKIKFRLGFSPSPPKQCYSEPTIFAWQWADLGLELGHSGAGLYLKLEASGSSPWPPLWPTWSHSGHPNKGPHCRLCLAPVIINTLKVHFISLDLPLLPTMMAYFALKAWTSFCFVTSCGYCRKQVWYCIKTTKLLILVFPWLVHFLSINHACC